MAIRYHLRLMAVVVNNIRILLIGCAVFLCGLSYADVEEEDSGALRIETETEEYSADIYLGNTDDRKVDRERKTIGVGERITLTLTGKPLGNVKEIEWKAEENGEEYVEMPQKTRGELSITVTARKRLRQGGFAVIQAITSEGRKVKTTLNVVIPSEIRAEHKNGGTATESLPEGLTAVIGASAVLKLTLYPTSVNFKNVKLLRGTRARCLPVRISIQGIPGMVRMKRRRFLKQINWKIMSREGFLPQTWNIPISPSRGIGCVRGASMMEKGGRERNILTAAKSWKFGAISVFRNFTGRKSGGRSDTIS